MSPEKVELPERHKPFILAVLTMGALLTVLFAAMINGKWDMLKDIVVWFSPWVSMSWAWYFKSRS